jgi:3-methyladenine DNA glycosylase AlkD
MVSDHEDMIVKALSWALRILSEVDRKAVETFVTAHKDVLAARVKREVGPSCAQGTRTSRRRKPEIRNFGGCAARRGWLRSLRA